MSRNNCVYLFWKYSISWLAFLFHISTLRELVTFYFEALFYLNMIIENQRGRWLLIINCKNVKNKISFSANVSLIFLKVQREITKLFQGIDFWARNLSCILRKRSRTTRQLRTTYDHFKMVFWAITPNSVTVKRRKYVASKRQNEIIIQ
jgi:hypothetical protein